MGMMINKPVYHCSMGLGLGLLFNSVVFPGLLLGGFFIISKCNIQLLSLSFFRFANDKLYFLV